ncbi:homoserine dehydrogenase [Ruminococcus sp.]|uniref:homoserine dehydrogenase n=1 Tax=Ruminococcus sp. TaxID=41978 RepID=UPI0025CD9CA2|nr:homoserine dehydrogenase [Ruminococcus sp.]MCR4639154.1 homoserine dehydrogenase [Ruminococcus sp.]
MSAKFAVLGHGVVGSGVVELFYKNKKSIEKHAGTEMDIKYILDLRDFPDSPYADKFTKNFDVILNDDEVVSVAECMGGVEPAFTFVKACLEKGKSVSTSNKELVAEKGDILLQTAKAHNCNFFFEASVGGAIPIIRPLHRCLAANDITKVAGILNGTTNFILTKMYNDNMPFAEALKLAQELGYAEKDPTADIEGHDACRKICIISSLVFGKHVYPKSVYTKGITEIQLSDVEASDVLGYAIKLIACVSKQDNGKILPSVMPMLVSYDSIMSGVNDVFNAVLVYGDGIDQTMFYGRGAGKLPTASAVMGDVIEAVKHNVTVFSQSWESSADNSFVETIDNFTSRWYFRVPSGSDMGGVEVYNSENGLSYVTTEKLTFTEAKAKAAELNALAYLPVLE